MIYYVVLMTNGELYLLANEEDIAFFVEQHNGETNLWTIFRDMDNIDVTAIYKAELTNQGIVYTARLVENMNEVALYCYKII